MVRNQEKWSDSVISTLEVCLTEKPEEDIVVLYLLNVLSAQYTSCILRNNFTHFRSDHNDSGFFFVVDNKTNRFHTILNVIKV